MAVTNKKYIMKLMQLPGQRGNINKKEAEELFTEFATKLMNKEELSDEEKKYMNTYMKDFYPEIGGSLYPYPKYDEKLKPIYEKLSDYYLKHMDEIDYNSAVFLQYYYLTGMAKEYKIRPSIKIGNDYFKKHPNAKAYHTYGENPYQLITEITYNPNFIKEEVDNKCIFNLIIAGFHELEHDVQHTMAYSEELTNPQALLWAKEILIRKKVDKTYYKRNYWALFHEKDARNVALQKVKKIVREKKITPIVNEEWAQDDSYDLSIEHKNIKGDSILAIDLLDSIVTPTIKNNPKLLDEYPVLKNIYNTNGSKKTYVEIKTEIGKRMRKEMKEHPEDRNIMGKYLRLFKGTVNTDNNLKLQQYADNIIIAKQKGQEKVVELERLKMEKLMKERDFSYMEFTTNYKNRIATLTNKSHKSDITIEERRAIYEELNQTRKLLNTMLEYNSNFKEEHKKEIDFSKSFDSVRSLLKTTPSEYKYILGEKNIIAEQKTEEELTNDFERDCEIIREKAKTKEEAEKNINILQEYYSKLKNNLKDQKKKTAM